MSLRPDLLIVGQGLAGTLLAWECERAGISFAVADRGHASATSLAAAGLINPVTGRRLVKSWRIDSLLPAARATYRELETALGVPLWHELRMRRLFADATERRIFAEKQARGELAPYVAPDQADEEGFWIAGAARVDLGALLSATRTRWKKQGRLRETEINLAREVEQHDLVIDCTGVSGARGPWFDFVPWEFSKGEALEIAVGGLPSDLALNRRHAIVALGTGRAWVGATHEPGILDAAPTAAARTALEATARALLSAPFEITNHRVGVRVNLPDKHPVAGRHPRYEKIGVINGLGAKGAMLAPWLARQWVNHLTEAVPFDPEVAVGRFSGRNSSHASSP